MKRFTVLAALAFVAACCFREGETTGSISSCAKELFADYNSRFWISA